MGKNKGRQRKPGWLRRTGIEILGWTLVVLGLAALVLPGPGLLTLVAGLAVLSQQYVWAERQLHPIKVKAFHAAAEGVKTWPRISVSFLGVAWIIGVGIFWGMQPPVPGWWPLGNDWWLPGGWGTASTMIGSGVIAFVLIIYSIRRFRGKPHPERAAEQAAEETGPEETRPEETRPEEIQAEEAVESRQAYNNQRE